MSKQHKPEKPPWQPRIEQPAEFHTGVPPRNLIGEVLDPPTLLDELDAEGADDTETAEEPSVASAPIDPTAKVR
jgi:hypothetical protein